MTHQQLPRFGPRVQIPSVAGRVGDPLQPVVPPVYQAPDSSILYSFARPAGSITGMTFDGANLISVSASTDLIYIHDRVTPVVSSSFAAPALDPTGLAFLDGNLISCDDVTDTIYHQFW